MRKKLMGDTNDLLEPHELLEILLFYCIPRRNTNEIAHSLLESIGSIPNLFAAKKNEIEKVFYVSDKTSSLLGALGEFKNRIEKENKKQRVKFVLDKTEFPEYILKIISKMTKKGLYIIFIDNVGKPILAKRIKCIDKRFVKDIVFKKNVFEIGISGAFIVDYSEKSVDIPSLITLEKIKYYESCLALGGIELYDYYITDGKEALGVKEKNKLEAKKRKQNGCCATEGSGVE